MGHTSTRIFAPITIDPVNNINDVGAVIGESSGDWGTLCTSQNINKFAKWKPVKSSEKDLPTVVERQCAGRDSVSDYSMQYGTRASGVGTVTALADLTVPTFTYTPPSGQPNEWFRIRDFVHPTEDGYGYRHDAYFDFNGTPVWVSGTGVIVQGQDYGINLQINYNPHSTTLRKEMLSIRDFLTADGATQYDPLNTYPCILIEKANKYYLHGLYKGSATTVSTIGTTGLTEWHMSSVNLPSSMGTGACTISFILVSQQIILHSSPNLDIANWITVNSGEEAAWEAWFCPIINATGISGQIAQATPSATVATATSIASQDTNRFRVVYSFDNAYSGVVTVRIDVTDTQSGNSVSDSYTFQNGVGTSVYFMELNYSDMGIIAMMGQTFTFDVYVTTTIGTSESHTSGRFTFTIQSLNL